MSCITGPKLPNLADIPILGLLLGDISIDLPDLNAKLCCEVNLITPPIPIPIGTILKSLLSDPTGVAATNLETALTLINQIINQANTIMAALTFDCPLD